MDITSDTFSEAKKVYRSESGTYELANNSSEPWQYVFGSSKEVQLVSKLRGWGDWTHSLRIYRNGAWSYWFAK